MTRPRSLLAGLALAAIAVAGCGGQGDASQEDVSNDVSDRLQEDGYVAAPGEEAVEVSEEQADAVGSCVARTMFEDTERWSKDERNAATRTNDGDDPDPDLVVKVEELVNDCYDEVVGGDGPATSGPSEDDEATTTTED